jgi:hypothetical protein
MPLCLSINSVTTPSSIYTPKLTTQETIKAKHAFETHLKSYGVIVQQYHADNGRFQDVAFKQDCIKNQQKLSFCGVNAHFQNGRAEKKIRDLQDNTRTSLLHAMRKWPDVITINLWPYAMRYAMDVNNCVPAKGKEQSPLELLSGIKTKIPLRQIHHFGCPTYILTNELQAGRKAGTKWKDRARLGVNLGFSPQHACSVHLILSLTTGCVSPQFHFTFDEHFSTVKDYTLPHSTWQEKAHFIEASDIRQAPSIRNVDSERVISSNKTPPIRESLPQDNTNEGVGIELELPQPNLPEFNPQDLCLNHLLFP